MRSGFPPLIGRRKIGLDVISDLFATVCNAFLPNGKKRQWHFSALTEVFKRTKKLLGGRIAGRIVPATSSRMMTAHDMDVVPAIGSRSLRVSGGGWQSHLARARPVAGVARVLTSILIVRTPGGCP
jgi:hypothetical protein